jgi:MFS family permease
LCLLAIPVLAFSPLPCRQAAPAVPVAWWPIPKVALQAMLFCTCGYSLMGMVMLASPLAMAGCGFHAGDAAGVIQWHLLGMFAPSLLTGKWIARWGATTIAWAGVVILALGCSIALASESLLAFHCALFVVGLGWNFMYMGGSTLLTQIPDALLRSRLQAINEFITFSSITLISGLTGWVYVQLGWQAILLMGIVLLLGMLVLQGRRCVAILRAN